MNKIKNFLRKLLLVFLILLAIIFLPASTLYLSNIIEKDENETIKKEKLLLENIKLEGIVVVTPRNKEQLKLFLSRLKDNECWSLKILDSKIYYTVIAECSSTEIK